MEFQTLDTYNKPKNPQVSHFLLSQQRRLENLESRLKLLCGYTTDTSHLQELILGKAGIASFATALSATINLGKQSNKINLKRGVHKIN